MIKIKNSLNYDYTEDSDIEYPKGKSITIPDQTMSLSNILKRHARGLPVIGRENIYHGDEDYMPNVKTLDLAEQQEMREQTAEYIRFTQDKLKKLQTEQDKQKAEARKQQQEQLFKEFKEFQAAKQQNSAPNEEQQDAR